MAFKRPVTTSKPRVPCLWSVSHVGHFAPEYGRLVAVFWDEDAAIACSAARNKTNWATDYRVYAYEDEMEYLKSSHA